MELQIGVDDPLLLGALLLLLSALASAAMEAWGGRLRVPSALLFLGLGMLVGEDVLGLVSLDDPALVQNIGVVALLFILFEGGLTTKPTDLRLAALPGGLLATVGVVITAAVTGFGTWLLLDVPPLTAALLGAVVASTDAAAVFSMMRTTPLPRRTSALLRLESGANDPIAAMLTVGLVATATGDGVTAGDWVRFATVQLVGGVATGVALGAVGTWLLRRVQLRSEGLYPVVAAAMGALAYGAAAAFGASGFVAVYVAGVVIGSRVPRHRRSILGTHEAFANAAEIGLFLILGLLVSPPQLVEVIVPALLVSAVLVLVARPITVWLCTLFQGFGWRERVLLAWGGLRGAVPIVLATFPATAQVEGAGTIFNVVFFVVLVSVLVQGLGLLPLVRRLGLDVDQPAWAPVAEALPIHGVDVDIVELNVTEDLALVGRRLGEGPLPASTLVAAVVRRDRVVIPRGETKVLPGDVLLLTAQRRGGDMLARVTAWARGELPGTSPPHDPVDPLRGDEDDDR